MGLHVGLTKKPWKYQMRASEFIKEDASAGASCAGSVATVAMPMTGGTVLKRIEPPKPGKYANSLPQIGKKHARR